MNLRRSAITVAAVLACTAALLSCSKSELDNKMAELHTTLSLSNFYIDEFHIRVNALKRQIESAEEDSVKADAAFELFKEYERFNTDSAKACVALLLDMPDTGFPKDVVKAWQYAIDGDRARFMKIFGPFDPSGVEPRYRNDCYAYMASSFLFLKPADDDLCMFMSKAALDPAIQTDVKEMFLGTIYRFELENSYALEHFMKAYEASTTTHMQSKTAYLVAHAYDALGSKEKYEYWLAQSAIHDLHVPVKSYSAMQDLAMAELDRGRYKSASDMVDVFMKDAMESKHWVRIQTAVKYEKAIISAVGSAEKRSIWGLACASVLLLLILMLVLALLRRNMRQRRMLAQANASIEEMNKALTLSDKEKEEYIHKYMKLSLNYLGSVEQYRHKLRVLLKEAGKDAVIAQLRGPSESESQYSDFYKEFDETFLKIYPNFVRGVNELLKPEARFENEHALNLPLRVLAAIKLGIKESKEIAIFLNCAPASVYTYRSKMKANAISDKDEFESEVCRIS